MGKIKIKRANVSHQPEVGMGRSDPGTDHLVRFHVSPGNGDFRKNCERYFVLLRIPASPFYLHARKMIFCTQRFINIDHIREFHNARDRTANSRFDGYSFAGRFV